MADEGQKQTDEVEAGVRGFVEQILGDYARLSPNGPSDIAERRRLAAQIREPWVRGGPQMADIADLKVGPMNVPVRIYSPTSNPALPCFIYLHGGGWMLFSVDTHDRLMREYAGRAGINVIGVDYSRAPEARFPIAVEEARSVANWLRSSEGEQHLQPPKIAIGGDSAGANLALTTNLALRDAGEQMLDASLLNYGAFDTEPRASHARYDGPNYMLTSDEMAEFWDNYLDVDSRDNPLARPLLADLMGLPPTFLCIAECDILLDENREMERRLRSAGVAVTAKIYPGATHSFLEAVSRSDLADRALADASTWLFDILRS